MTLVLELKPETLRRIKEQAAKAGTTPEQMLVEMAETKFDGDRTSDPLAEYLLKKNAELYRRLA